MKQEPESTTRFLKKNGKITPLLGGELEKVLSKYSDFSVFLSDSLNRPREDFTVKEVYIVGSILRGNDASDLDLLFIANKIDQNDYVLFKNFLSQAFFNNKPKTEALDVFVRPYDEFPSKPSYEVTKQVKKQVDRYNRVITSKKFGF